MKHILFAIILASGLNALANDLDYTCKGKDREGHNLTIKFDEWADNQQSSRADVTIDVEGAGPSRTTALSVYAGDDGFDYGVTSEKATWMFHLILPPNMLGNGKVAARYYYDNDLSIEKSVVLECEAGLK